MKKFILGFIFIFFLILFYTFVIPVRIHFVDFYEVKRAFSTVRDEGAVISQNDTPNGYFFTDTSVGYFDVEGTMIHRFDCPDNTNLTANIYGYITYLDNDNSATIYSNVGREIQSIGTTKIPYFAGDLPYFYALHRDGLGFCMYSLNGERLYETISNSSMITTINQNVDGVTIVSDMDGYTNIYSMEGNVIHSNKSDYSKINFAKTSVISVDNDRFAICSGIEPEVMEIFSFKTGTRQFKFDTDTDFRRSVQMHMNKDYFYYEGNSCLKRLNLKKKKTEKFVFAGVMCDVKYDNDGSMLILSSNIENEKEIYYLNLYAPNGIRKYYREFNSPVDNINFTQDGMFYFRLNENIVVCNKTSV